MSCQIKPSGCAYSRQREGGVTHGNDVSVDRKQRKKETEKTTKYAPLRWEMKDRYPRYVQINVIVDLLGGYSLEVGNKMMELFGEKRACKRMSYEDAKVNTFNYLETNRKRPFFRLAKLRAKRIMNLVASD